MPKPKTNQPSSPTQDRLRLILALLVVLFLVYFLFTGNDPLGLFTEQSTPTPPVAEQTTPNGTEGVGEWWSVYFTEPNANERTDEVSGAIVEQLLARIAQAQQSIQIAAFEFNVTQVAEALIAAHNRGVEVQWVTDNEYGIEADEEEGHGQFALLQAAGIPIKDDARSALMHNKFWIFDQQVVWTGSTNITVNGFMHNNNNVIIIENPDVAAIYEREFAELWAGAFGTTSPSTIDQQATVIDDTPVQVYFAAEDDVIDHLIPLIANAQQQIRFMAFSFTHSDLGAAVLARAQAGVDVQGIFETRGSETDFSQLPPLFCAGVPVRQDGNPRTFHHKIFIIDGATVVTGSLNFSVNANESNDENVIILQQPAIAARYLEEFSRRWQEAQAPDAADMHCS